MNKIIDVHHHIVPEPYVKALGDAGIADSHGRAFPQWSVQSGLELMDKCGITGAMASISMPGVYFGDDDLAIRLARECNEFSAKLCADYPERFGFFGFLPLPLVERSIEEAVYCLDELKADGIVLLCSSGDKFLGDPDYEELMQELDRRNTVVYTHPNLHSSSTQIDTGVPDFIIEVLFDTTRAVVKLVTSGAMERHANIKWILSHAGGTIPYIAWRLSLVDFLPEFKEKAPQGMMTYLKSFYYDTALSTSEFAFKPMLDLLDTSHIVFGSDTPFAPDELVAAEVATLQSLDCLDADTLSAIQTNGAALFPRFAHLIAD